MDRSRDSKYNIGYVVDPELHRLFYKRARAKYRVDLELEYITPLLNAGPEHADSLSIKEVESHMKDFKLAHRGYMERIIENTNGAKEEMDLTIGECKDYLKKVIERVQEVIALHSNFRFKLQVSKLKVELCKKFEDYNREKSRV